MAADSITPARVSRVLLAGFCALAAAMLISPLIGPAPVHLGRALAGQWPDNQLFFGVRLPRMLMATLAGGALSIAGALFQALLRDPLATPYTLGVSSGASLGAVLVICFGLQISLGLPALWLAALAGAGLSLVLVLAIASEGRRLSSFTLLLAGVTLNSVVMSLIMLLHNMADFGQSFAIVHWLMGSIDPLDYPSIAILAVIVCGVSLWLCANARQWNLMSVGEDWAQARGVSPQRLLLAGYLAGSLLTAAVTAITGPIGFVGLVVPHALRLRLGSDHRLLMPASFLMGAAFLIACDTLARTALSVEIPVSVVTALLGGPFFVALLRSRKRSLWL